MYNIDLRFGSGLTDTQIEIFKIAAARWQDIITSDLPFATVAGETIDDILIESSAINIDGMGGILGQATFTHLRNNSFLPAKGFMEFDAEDLRSLQEAGSLRDIILHEIGHVIGFGTIWDTLDLIEDRDGPNPVFIGPAAMSEYGQLLGQNGAVEVPLANTGGPGTRGSHLRETVFGNELMTGFFSGTARPISRLSLAILEDMGYTVNYDMADAYTLPSAAQLKTFQAEAVHVCMMRKPETVTIVPC